MNAMMGYLPIASKPSAAAVAAVAPVTHASPKRRRRNQRVFDNDKPEMPLLKRGLLRGSKVRERTPEEDSSRSSQPRAILQTYPRRPISRARAYQPTASWLRARAPAACSFDVSFRKEFCGG